MAFHVHHHILQQFWYFANLLFLKFKLRFNVSHRKFWLSYDSNPIHCETFQLFQKLSLAHFDDNQFTFLVMDLMANKQEDFHHIT